jgi:dihydrofolate reductase/thymidylate synthase
MQTSNTVLIFLKVLHSLALAHNSLMQCVVIAAATADGGIGYEGALPWPPLDGDLAYFGAVTTDVMVPGARNAVIMGRRTWESLPLGSRPLRQRLNIVVTSTPASVYIPTDPFPGRPPTPVLVVSSLPDALAAADDAGVERAFVIGGARLYEEAMLLPGVRLVLTRVQWDGPCDVVVPGLSEASIATHWDRLSRHVEPAEAPAHGPSYTVTYLRRKRGVAVSKVPAAVSSPVPSPSPVLPSHPEMQYLQLVAAVLERGEPRKDRTAVGTRALFASKLNLLEFPLDGNQWPLLTTKRMNWKSVVEELLWFLHGCTDSKVLEARGVRIWSGNGSRDFLDSRGLVHNRDGDLGPVYGFQWRHFGARYKTADDDYTGCGVDQIEALVTGLRRDPAGRRHILSAWNPADLDRMALPPCHMLSQFWVGADGLHCMMIQRSGDLGLGVPFNIASYALLTRLVAAAVGIPAARLSIMIGDAHVYNNHVDELRTQLTRAPHPFPVLELHPPADAVNPDGTVPILAWRAEHVRVVGYTSHGPLPMPMAV